MSSRCVNFENGFHRKAGLEEITRGHIFPILNWFIHQKMLLRDNYLFIHTALHLHGYFKITIINSESQLWPLQCEMTPAVEVTMGILMKSIINSVKIKSSLLTQCICDNLFYQYIAIWARICLISLWENQTFS